MELRSLSGDERLPPARENLIRTYAGLACSLPDTIETQLPCFRLFRSPKPFSFCNMAIEFSGEAPAVVEAASDLRRIGESSNHFRVSVLTGDPETLRPALEQVGMACVHRLRWLISDGATRSDECAEMRQAVTEEERNLVGDFIVEGFFLRHGRTFKSAVHATTVRSPFELWWTGSLASPRGAYMLAKTPGCFGVFNLLVAAPERRKGLGRFMMGHAASEACRNGAFLSVQCDESLVSWYRSCGFLELGTVESFANVA